MCGIVAYIGSRQALAILIAGLKRLEYRGYDSAGVGLIQEGGEEAAGGAGGGASALKVIKKLGKVVNLEEACKHTDSTGTLGIAHTRWATHGAPSDLNSHPHTDNDNSVAVVHNGIIENYKALKEALSSKGCVFRSETDTELLAHLVAMLRKEEPHMSLDRIVSLAMMQTEGTFGCAFIFADQPNLLIGARKGSPLILGVSDGEFILASDASAIIEHTRRVVYLNDGELVVCTREAFQVKQLTGELHRTASIHTLDMTLSQIEKAGYKHFMLKEIMEQPTVLENCMRGRVSTTHNKIVLGGLADVMDKITGARRLIICACGTSYHAGLVGEYLIETLARIPVEVEYASEFRYRKPILFKDDVVVVISQSGETADTLAAVRQAHADGAIAIGLVNSVGSTIARETDAGVYLHVGPEIGVASTKAFTGQVTVLTMMALQLASYRGLISDEEMTEHIANVAAIPDLIRAVLEQAEAIKDLARSFRYASSFLYLGRGYNYPVALEGALKLKEISYIHAEGYAAAEMKHGPIALIDVHMPVVIIAPRSDPMYSKIVSNVEEVLSRKGNVIIVTEDDNHDFDEMVESVIYIPKTVDYLLPLLTVVPLQLLSYYVADLRKCSVDQPRNLAKSVTVE